MPRLSLSSVEAIRVLWSRKTYVHIVIVGCLANFVLFGILQWMPTFVIRKFELELAQVGIFFGAAIGLGQALGAILGGYVADNLARRDLRWLIRIPFVVSFFYLPVYELAIFAGDAASTLALIFIISVIGATSFGPVLAIMQSVTPPQLRATAAAVYALMGSVIGFGGAPFIIGVMSDAFAHSMTSAEALQGAMGVAALAALAIPFHVYRAMHFFSKDMTRSITQER
jgi:MFS family permease